MTITPCDRCGTLASTTACGEGHLLALCARCPLGADCGEYRHQYRGARETGTWVCGRCGKRLASGKLSTDVVKVPQPDMGDASY